VLDVSEILRTPRAHWPTTTVGEICAPAILTSTAAADDDAAAVLAQM
jgi:hypothetical protein